MAHNPPTESELTRGIDAHAATPSSGARQPVQAPEKKLDAVTEATGSVKRKPNDAPAKPAHDLRPTAGGQLEADEGVAEKEKDPIE